MGDILEVRNLSIKRKLTAIVTVTSGVAVILASALFLYYDYLTFRERMVTELETTAEMPGNVASPALAAESAASGLGTQARQTLAHIVGSLRAYENIEQSVIFDANGRVAGGQERNILKPRHARLLRPQHPRLHHRGAGPLPRRARLPA